MTVELPDGTIVPSFLGITRSGVAGNTGMQTNLALRVGEVKAIIYPDDPKSVSGTFIEYKVFVQQQDAGSPGVGMVYNNCLLVNTLAGVADKVRYTLRAASAQQHDTNKLVGNGSKVLLLCINGATHNAIILGGVRTPVKNPAGGDVPDSESDGHNYYFGFNGAQMTVNDDGELQFKFRGKTNADDTLADGASPDAEGSTLLFSKDGSITTTSPDGKQSIKIDHANHKVKVVADQEMDLTSGGHVVVQSEGVLVGGATDAWMLGTTYREAQTELHTQLLAQLNALFAALTAAGAALTTASPLMVLPVVGPMLVAPELLITGTQLTAAAGTAQAMADAITAFEAGTEAYLSKKNLTD